MQYDQFEQAQSQGYIQIQPAKIKKQLVKGS
jgi:hypothetical protein